MDAVGVGFSPLRNANPAVAAFFVVYMIFGSFFVLQLFVSVTIEKVCCQGLAAVLRASLSVCRLRHRRRCAACVSATASASCFCRRQLEDA